METLKSLLHSLKRVLIIIAVIALLVLSIRVTKPDLVKLVSSFPKAKSIMGQLLRPEILGRESEKITVAQLVPVPCGSVANPEVPASGPRITVDPPCGNPKDKVQVRGYELPKNAELSIRWILPDGGLLSIKNAVTNANGELTETMELRPITAAVDGKPAQLAFEITLPEGKVVASQTLKDVLDAMFVTIFMALIATTIGTIFAVPLSFLAASNITRKGWLGSAVYYIVRAFLNIIRSYEPLVLATIFAMIVGFGSPFAGVIALSITTAASLGKMFSESVEGIDSGPIEAVTATGANKLQVVVYAVVPQIIPDFLSFTIYHWDINVRISTIIGFVGGGGIGYFLSQRINTLQYSQSGTALLAIILVVWALDFLSSEIRKQLV
ncbi:MAG TPA: phosphonate ABC transporter, permease protein PhnE [Anaerolineaceae bacterium]|jgi:phosphonate transport system permease protein|nr:phosphonate ABC transporter, permease protein PhnE [Anaerolineaceae bacterium]NMC18215.1 phosphonate ABC transporter, permease protein PhnE [Chloroflexota bacterium]HNS06889.1 phosphonate ABC transporter, permease protein PhnE [Anaerolineaceae bacterium]HNW13202.1 phosphonate ABC transporter, permease protein PhnE [Anaerolineaceae bacterium]HOQ69999.1 phosphonate ABC transporter, permease protein PhnE [Anaerolineaceae bacterium]